MAFDVNDTSTHKAAHIYTRLGCSAVVLRFTSYACVWHHRSSTYFCWVWRIYYHQSLTIRFPIEQDESVVDDLIVEELLCSIGTPVPRPTVSIGKRVLICPFDIYNGKSKCLHKKWPYTHQLTRDMLLSPWFDINGSKTHVDFLSTKKCHSKSFSTKLVGSIVRFCARPGGQVKQKTWV